MLEIGSKAPDIALKDDQGNIRRLEEFRGKKIVLYFYPKDNTPGCTNQACSFAKLYPQFNEKGAQVIGVSKDSVESHRKFKDKYKLPFILLSDPDLEMAKAYGVWKEKTVFGKTALGVVRSTFLIDEEGKIAKVFEKVKAK